MCLILLMKQFGVTSLGSGDFRLTALNLRFTKKRSEAVLTSSVTSVLLVSVSLSVSVSTPLFVLSGRCRPLLLRLPLLCCR